MNFNPKDALIYGISCLSLTTLPNVEVKNSWSTTTTYNISDGILGFDPVSTIKLYTNHSYTNNIDLDKINGIEKLTIDEDISSSYDFAIKVPIRKALSIRAKVKSVNKFIPRIFLD